MNTVNLLCDLTILFSLIVVPLCGVGYLIARKLGDSPIQAFSAMYDIAVNAMLVGLLLRSLDD